jgi:hypothetical protein
MKSWILFMSIVVILGYAGCKKNTGESSSEPVDCSVVDSHFAGRVLPIVQASCAVSSGCHGNGSINGPGVLSNFTQISNAANSIRNAVSSGSMPKDSRLSAADKNAILCWISSGTPNN